MSSVNSIERDSASYQEERYANIKYDDIGEDQVVPNCCQDLDTTPEELEGHDLYKLVDESLPSYEDATKMPLSAKQKQVVITLLFRL